MSMEVHAKHITAKQAPFKTPDNCNGKFADLSFSILPGLRPSGLIANKTQKEQVLKMGIPHGLFAFLYAFSIHRNISFLAATASLRRTVMLRIIPKLSKCKKPLVTNMLFHNTLKTQRPLYRSCLGAHLLLASFVERRCRSRCSCFCLGISSADLIIADLIIIGLGNTNELYSQCKYVTIDMIFLNVSIIFNSAHSTPTFMWAMPLHHAHLGLYRNKAARKDRQSK